MKWKHVFNSNLGSWRNLDEAVEAAVSAQYKFIAWNGIVYFICMCGALQDTRLRLNNEGDIV